MNIAANLLKGKGAVILYDKDFPSVTLPWLNLGYEVQFFKNHLPGKITLDDIESVRTEKSRILVISHVQYANGIRVNLDMLGDYCSNHNLILVIDAAQSMGVVPINIKKQGIHILTGTGYKWLCAGYGVALVAIDLKLLSNHLPLVGWKSVKDAGDLDNKNSDFFHCAQSLEMGHAPFCGILALEEAIKLISELGIVNVQNRLLYLTGYLQEQVLKAGLKLHSPTAMENQSAISSIEVERAEKVTKQLLEQNIIVSARGAGIRVSPHIYNNTDDIDRLIDALKF